MKLPYFIKRESIQIPKCKTISSNKRERIIEKAVKYRKEKEEGMLRMVVVKDHLGKEYSSLTDMCNTYHIRMCTYLARIKRGMSVEQALTINVKATGNKQVVDPLGNVYDNAHNMCKAHGISYTEYNDRKNKGCSLKECLTKKKKARYEDETIDHLGNKYNSLFDMCKAYKIERNLYKSRRDKGYSIEESLCAEINKIHSYKRVD